MRRGESSFRGRSQLGQCFEGVLPQEWTGTQAILRTPADRVEFLPVRLEQEEILWRYCPRELAGVYRLELAEGRTELYAAQPAVEESDLQKIVPERWKAQLGQPEELAIDQTVEALWSAGVFGGQCSGNGSPPAISANDCPGCRVPAYVFPGPAWSMMGFCKEGTLLIGLNPSMAWVSPGVGEGVGWQLEYQWPWSAAFTIIAILVLEAVVLAFYLGERGCRPGWLRIVLAQLRVLAFLLVGVMLSGLALGLFRTGLPSLAIVVDDSLSMVTIDRYPPQVEKNLRQSLGLEATEALSRWRIVQRLFSPGGGEWLESTKSRYRVQVELLSQLGLARRAQAQKN